MSEVRATHYWLFQSNPAIFDLVGALREEVMEVFVVKNHQKNILPGDQIILWQSGKQAGCYGLATTVSEVGEWPIPEAQQGFFKEEISEAWSTIQLKIEYNLWNRPVTRDLLPSNKAFDRFYAGLPGTNYKASPAQYQILEHIVGELDVVNEPREMYLPRKARQHPLNTILYGPPGTGKTFTAISFALSIIENRSLEELSIEDRTDLRRRFNEYLASGQVGFVTFHQAFSYEDFVEGIKPRTINEQVVYEIENGLFKQMNDAALEAPEESFVLIIDEINRGNIAGIFGELITLLEADKRKGAEEALELQLPYSKHKFCVAPNLHLVATMNTADRSVESLDMALRRRFHFIEMLPQPEVIRQVRRQPLAAGIDLEKMLQVINQRIEVLLGSDYCIGHTYFLYLETLADLKSVFSTRLIPLLQEYFMGDYSKIGLVLGKDFVVLRPRNTANLFADFEHDYAADLADKKVYQLRSIQDLSEADFIRIYDREYQ